MALCEIAYLVGIGGIISTRTCAVSVTPIRKRIDRPFCSLLDAKMCIDRRAYLSSKANRMPLCVSFSHTVWSRGHPWTLVLASRKPRIIQCHNRRTPCNLFSGGHDADLYVLLSCCPRVPPLRPRVRHRRTCTRTRLKAQNHLCPQV